MRVKTTVGIREATDADAAAIAVILNEEIATSPYVYAETLVTLEDRRAWLSDHQAAGLPVFVAMISEESSDIVGWGALSPYRAASGYRLTSEMSVYVAPAVQRRGIATALMSALIERGRELGHRVLVASIDSENAASVALFGRFGFAECGRLPEVGRKFGAWRTQLLFMRTLGRSRISTR